MKAIIKHKPAEETLIYETSDGQQFFQKEEAELHELLIKINHRPLKEPFSNCEICYLTSKEDLKAFETYLCEDEHDDFGSYDSENFIYPNWYVSQCADNAWSWTVKTLEEFKKEAHSQIDNLQ